MVRVKVLKRNPLDSMRETKHDIHKLPRVFDPAHHPMEEAREYTRALNAAKLERVFAKPFLADLNGHKDGVVGMAQHPNRLGTVASVALDGEVRLWDLQRRACVMRGRCGASALARGLTWEPTHGDRLYVVGDDKQVRVWDTSGIAEAIGAQGEAVDLGAPIDSVMTKNMLTGISHHRKDKSFATCGEATTLWDAEMGAPLQEYNWGVDSVHCVKFNQVETNILGACASDRSIILYDIRESRPMRKVVMELKTNALAWNPMEAFVFLSANEDYNTYAFDIRNLQRPLQVHMDHTSAVTDVCYAPTGKEFVSGSYDKTVRLYETDQGHSREIYHTKRMQRLTCVVWSADNRYIMSASDEMNIRLWKARAWEKMGAMRDRERSAIEYADKLKEKYAEHPKVRAIQRKRHVPKHVLNAQKEHQVIKESKKRKEANRRKHSKPGAVPYVAERDKHIVNEQE